MSETPAISLQELQLAARNHGMPLELLREPVTPVGLHYLLIHYDIPAVDAETWRLDVDGRTYSLDELRTLPSHEVVSTMECAGNGRANLEPHVVSQPWLLEAVGTGRWRGVRLRDLIEPRADTVEVLFTGLDRGVEGGEEQLYQRSLTVEDALADDVLLAYDLNGAPLPPQHGFPLRLLVPGWYGMTNVKSRADRAARRAVRRLPADARLSLSQPRGRSRRARVAHRASRADGAAGHPRHPHA